MIHFLTWKGADLTEDVLLLSLQVSKLASSKTQFVLQLRVKGKLLQMPLPTLTAVSIALTPVTDRGRWRHANIFRKDFDISPPGCFLQEAFSLSFCPTVQNNISLSTDCFYLDIHPNLNVSVSNSEQPRWLHVRLPMSWRAMQQLSCLPKLKVALKTGGSEAIRITAALTVTWKSTNSALHP